jgi:dienelactone hydrolase
VAGMRQAVLDIRRGAAFLAAQQAVDSEGLGIFGISLGGITSGLAAAIEPRFRRCCMMLAGGDIGEVGWTSRELAPLREGWLASGGTRETFFAALASVDPITYAARMRDRRILMLNARHDEVIPRRCTESLWRAFGEPEIVWLDAGHYSAVRFMLDGLTRVERFFAAA